MKDLSGEKFGRWKVVSFSGLIPIGREMKMRRAWNCVCECGTERVVMEASLGKRSMSCGCRKLENISKASKLRKIDHTGKRFGLLVVVRESDTRGNRGQVKWDCICDCGNRISVMSNNISRRAGSCGCSNNKRISELNKTHGMAHSNEYAIWRAIKTRCLNKSSAAFSGYGARGITICDRWKNSFEAFYADMGPRPSKKHSVDRYPDQNGNYEPGNCRWATPKQQARNVRTNRIIEYKGEKKPLAEWCDSLGLKYGMVLERLNMKWDVERAFTAPSRFAQC